MFEVRAAPGARTTIPEGTPMRSGGRESIASGQLSARPLRNHGFCESGRPQGPHQITRLGDAHELSLLV